MTDNLKVTPADYSPYCVTVPTDDRLPLSGQSLCGLYDINPNAFGQVDNLITSNNEYGKQEEIYNGVDVNFQVRLLGKATLGGGWNIGNAVQLGIAAGGSASAGTDTCYVVDSPQQLFNCHIDVPYQSRIKLNGSYTFPWGSRLPRSSRATRGRTTAPTAPSRSRRSSRRSGGHSPVVSRRSSFRSSPRSRPSGHASTSSTCVGRRSSGSTSCGFRPMSTPTTSSTSTLRSLCSAPYNARWGQPTQVLDGRLVKFSTQIDF